MTPNRPLKPEQQAPEQAAEQADEQAADRPLPASSHHAAPIDHAAETHRAADASSAADLPQPDVPRPNFSANIDQQLGGDADVDCDVDDDFSQCLQFIKRVQREDPECLADLLTDASVKQAAAPADDLQETPRQIGRFQIRRQIGQGGFGLVFLAFDPELERDVALKVPRVEALLTQQTRERFLREAKAAASLQHPNIATIYESGQVGPICYIASAYLAGGSLAETVHPDSPMSPHEAAHCLATLAEAVQHAHSRGVLHRDLKPANVLLDTTTRDDDPTDQSSAAAVSPSHASSDRLQQQLFIADFGLAKVVDDPTHHTQTGALVGTPAYMSPEQADSRLDEISTAADIYGLGAILYFLLTGRPPFEGDSTLAVLESVRSNEPASPRKLRDEIPRDLEAICLKCLEKDPQRRYPTANALAEDLQRWLNGEAVVARSTTTREHVARWVRRNPALSLMSSLTLLALIAGVVVSTLLWRQADRHASRAELQAAELKKAVDNLNAAIDMLFVTVSESPELKSRAAEPLRQKLLEQASRYYRLIQAQRPDNPELIEKHAETIFRLGLVNKQLGGATAAEQAMQEALAELASAPDSTRKRQFKIKWKRSRAQVLDQLGRGDDARKVRQDLLEQLNSRSHPTRLPDHEVQLYRAMLLSDTAGGELIDGNLSEAGKAARQAHEIWQSLPHPVSENSPPEIVLAYAHCLRVRGVACEETGRVVEAEGYLRDALQLLELVHSDAHDGSEDINLLLGRVHKKLGIAVAKQKRLEEAREIYTAGIEHLRQLCERHPDVPEYRMEWCSTRYSLSFTEFLLGNLDRTVELLERNVAEYARLGETYPDRRADYLNRQGSGWKGIATVRQAQENWQASADAHEKALQCYLDVEAAKPNWKLNQVLLAETELGLGNLAAQMDEEAKAIRSYQSARTRMQPVVAAEPEHDRARKALFHAHQALARIFTEQQRYELARGENDAALELFDGDVAWQAILRKSELLYHAANIDASQSNLENFVKSINADSETRLLDAARMAGKLAILSRNDQRDEAAERFLQVGRTAIAKATPDDETTVGDFKRRMADDPKLEPFFPKQTPDASPQP